MNLDFPAELSVCERVQSVIVKDVFMHVTVFCYGVVGFLGGGGGGFSFWVFFLFNVLVVVQFDQ